MPGVGSAPKLSVLRERADKGVYTRGQRIALEGHEEVLNKFIQAAERNDKMEK
jgi:hypothetical protein